MKILCFLLFVLLSSCNYDDHIYIINHQHWKVSVSSVTREWTLGRPVECKSDPGELQEVQRVWQGKRHLCVYRSPIDTPHRSITTTGWDRPLEWPFVPLGPGETKVASSECWLSYHNNRNEEIHFLTVPCWELPRYQRGSVWTAVDGAQKAEQLTEVR